MTTFLQNDASKIYHLRLDEIIYRSRYDDISQQLVNDTCFSFVLRDIVSFWTFGILCIFYLFLFFGYLIKNQIKNQFVDCTYFIVIWTVLFLRV